MDNPETLASLGTQDTGRIQPPPPKKNKTKSTTKHSTQKTKNHEQHRPH